MANNIEWSFAAFGPTIADPDDLRAEMEDDEIAIWLGSDSAAVLYGTPEGLRRWAERLIDLLRGK